MQLKKDIDDNIVDCWRGEPEMDNFLSIALDALNTMNTDVPIIINENRDYVQWRCKELILYVQAYDFLKGAGVGDTELETAKENIKQLTAEVYRRGKYWYFYYDNNFSLMLAGSIGLSAIVLNDEGDHWWNKDYLPKNWAHAAHWNIENSMWDAWLFGSMSTKGEKAGYAEGPHYFSYAFQHLIPFFNAFSNYVQQPSENSYNFQGVFPMWTGVVIDPTKYLLRKKVKNYNYDENWDNLYEWYHDILLPDGNCPTFDDCWPEGYQAFCALINSKVKDSEKYNYFNNPDWGNHEIRPEYLSYAIPPGSPNGKDHMNLVNTSSGDLIMRTPYSASVDESHYIRIVAEKGSAVNGGSHEHADLGSFIITAGSTELILDPGYAGYSDRNETCL